MSGADRYVVVGLARPRAPWFAEVSRWSTGAALPLDFRKCLSVSELRAHLAGPEPLSALLVDAATGAVDRDLVAEANDAGAAVLVVDERDGGRWAALGAQAVLPSTFDPPTLLDVLVEHAEPIRRVDAPTPVRATDADAPRWRGRLVTVLGPGGTGTSLTAMAIAQGLAVDPRHQGRVALADLALDADQGLLHDVGDVVPGLQELVEAHRGPAPGPDDVRALCFGTRSYAVLLGLRRHRDWTVLRPRAVEAAIDGLRQAFTAVVADCDGDLEGEGECGSLDVEDRNVLARSAVRAADVVVVTARPSASSIHRLVRLLGDVRRLGVDPARILPCVVAAPRSGRTRAELAAAVHELERPDGADPVNPVLFLPERRRLDQLVIDGRPLPAGLADTAASGVQAVVQQVVRRAAPATAIAPVPIAPGSLGRWTDQEATG
ncbi:MAG: hypothetical protein U0Q07_07900 [Acidimicrobiales bacterium]